MNFYESIKAFAAQVAGIRKSNAAHNAKVQTRQVARARLRGQFFNLIEGTRQERRKLSRAYAAKEFKSLRSQAA